MSKERQLSNFLHDILESIAEIKEFTQGITYEEFVRDKKTQKAVIRNLEIIGEAANKIPPQIQKNYSQIPWAEIISMRNKLIHEYFGVDLVIVWQTLEEDMIFLEKIIKKMDKDFYVGQSITTKPNI